LESISEMMATGTSVGQQINAYLMKALKEEEKLETHSKQITGFLR